MAGFVQNPRRVAEAEFLLGLVAPSAIFVVRQRRGSPIRRKRRNALRFSALHVLRGFAAPPYITVSHRNPSPQRLIWPRDGDGKCAKQHSVFVSQYVSKNLRRVAEPCFGS